MRLPLFSPREEPVPALAEERVALPDVIALVDAGHPEALLAFAQALGVRVLHVTEGPFEIEGDRAQVDTSSAERLRDALEGARVLVGAVVPALFLPGLTIAFARTPSAATFPAPARAVRERLDAVLSSARPELARNLAETRLRAV